MIKRDFVEKIADKTGINKVQVKIVVEDFLGSLREALAAGERVELRNLGVFTVKRRKQKVARNPKTGQQVTVPERSRICFKPSVTFKQRQSPKPDLFSDGA